MATYSEPHDAGRIPMDAATENHGAWATKEDWSKHQRLIGQLYEKQTLKEVMRYMASQHGFRATKKMYKTRITQWGFDKKNKENEMRALVHKRKQLDDQGKAGAFRVRGRLVDYKDVVRYWERKRVRIEDVIAQRTGSTTTEAVKCFTAPPSPITVPESIAIPERILVSIRDYFKGSFESGTWIEVDPRLSCQTTKVKRDAVDHLNALIDQSQMACRLFDNNRFAEGGRSLISATAKIKKIVLAEHPLTLANLFSLLAFLLRWRRHEIAQAILRQIYALAKVLIGEQHPLGCICGWLASFHQSQLGDIIVRSSRGAADHFENLIGPANWSTLHFRLSFIQEVDNEHGLSHKRFLLQDLRRQLEAVLGPLDTRIFGIRRSLAWNYYEDHEYAEAARLGWDLVALAQRLDILTDRVHYHAEGLVIVARSQYLSGEIHSAQLILREAINLRISGWGQHDNLATRLLVILEEWFLEQGQLNSAAQVQRQWKENLEASTDDS